MIVICDRTALRVHAAYGRHLRQVEQGGAVTPTLTDDDLAHIDIDAFTKRHGELHVMVGGRDLRRRKAGVTIHVCTSPIPARCIRKLKEGVYVASVGLAVVLMSANMGDYLLVRLLYEVCAIYRVESYREKSPALTSVKELRNELELLKGMRGVLRVEALLNYVADNSRSPRETDLAMLAWLPHRMGGYGLPLGAMNKQCSLGQVKRRCDLLFPQKEGLPRVGVEYESDEEHSGDENISSDSARRKVFENKGYRIVTFTNGELKSATLSFEAMRFIGTCLGLRVRKPRGYNAKMRAELLKFVNTHHDPLF